MNKKGIAVAGNMIVDMLYPIHGIPNPGELTTITADASRTIGGCLCNDIVDLAKLDPTIPLVALGRTGADEAGAFVMEKLHAHKNIDTQYVKVTGTTSFTLVMADEITKQRTFYHCRGGNAGFCEEDIPWEKLDVDLLHIGYILLLDALDAEDAQYGTKMAKLLAAAQAHGLKTSIDVVTEASDRFKSKVTPALKYTDYCVINEEEAQATTGICLRDADGTLHPENMEAALKALKAMGVSTWAVIHCPEGGWGLDENNNFVFEASVKLPKGYIAGTVGAGDAFCAGVLLAAQKTLPLLDAIHLGAAAACASLRMPGATEGMVTMEEVLELHKTLQ